MNLISCDGCGVVFDKSKLGFPSCIEKKDGSIDMKNVFWDGWSFVPFVKCPVCDSHILDSDD